MWERLIKMNPKFIIMYNNNYEGMYKLALDRGYKINENDLIKHKNLRNSTTIMDKAVEIDPNFIKYRECYNLGEYNTDYELIDDAMDRGYEPTIEDLEKNNLLGLSAKLIIYLIRNGHPEAIKFCKCDYRKLEKDNYHDDPFDDIDSSFKKTNYVEDALKNYTPTYEDLEKNHYLGNYDVIMKIILKENVNAIKYYKMNEVYATSEDDNLIKYAIDSGYVPNIDDVKRNNLLSRNSSIFEKLIFMNSSAILYYSGKDESIFKLALENDYKPKPDDLSKNFFLRYNDDIMLILIKEDSSLIKEYMGETEKIFEVAYNLGFKEDKIIEFMKTSTNIYSSIFKSKFIFKKILEVDVTLFNYYQGNDREIFELAFQKKYKPDEIILKRYYNNANFYTCVMKYNIEHFKYFKPFGDKDFKLVLDAVSLGYIPDEEKMESYEESFGFLYEKNDIVSKLIKIKPNYIKYYNGDDLNVYKIALENAFLPNEELVKYKLSRNLEIMVLIVKLNPEYIKYADKNYYSLTLLKILALDYVPTLEEVKKTYSIRSNYEAMKKLINIDYHYVECMSLNVEQSKELYEIAFNKGYRPKLDNLKDFLFYPNIIIQYLIKLDFNLIDKYDGVDINIFNLVIDKYPKIDIDKIIKMEDSYKKANYLIIYLIRTKNYNILKQENIKNIYHFDRLFEIAIKLGYNPTIKDISYKTWNCFDFDRLKNIVDNSNIVDCLNKICFLNLSDELFKEIQDYIYESKNIDFAKKYYDIINSYNYDKIKFIMNFSKYRDFLNKSNIREEDFIQYAFLISYDWFNDMLNIYNNNINEFIYVKNFFFDNYYFKDEQDSNSVSNIKAFIELLKNYSRYPELCLNIVNNKNKLNNEIISSLYYLFKNNDVIEEENKPKTIDDILKISSLFKNKYSKDLDNIEEKNIDEVKDVLCRLLFNDTFENVKIKLKIYGGTKNLRQLLFENKKNINLVDEIMEMMIFTSMMEDVIYSDDKEGLIEVSNRILDNHDLSIRCMMLFSEFEEKMRVLFEKELDENLTKLKTDGFNKDIIDENMTKEYGVEIIDFTDKKYCLLEHTMSARETEEELVNGIATDDKNTICLSPGSHRNQVIYRSNNSIIFATDEIPKGVFIRSSPLNMGSNGTVKNYSYEDTDSTSLREQRGVLKTSEAGEYNSEVLCFRQGIKFKYIILPGGREPSNKELEIAQNYNLKFVKIQELKTTIPNPKNIAEENLELKKKENNSFEKIEELKKMKKLLITKSTGLRKIAIFTDAHSLFEPTLAILEDARKNGITEIYSLGDNIGTGPNPKEVMELLDEYGVKSLKGNHELYATIGVDSFKEHLIDAGGQRAYDEALKNSTWTRNELTEKQLKEIEDNPEDRVVEIGGEEILLSHFSKDYNTGEEKEIPEGVSQVFQGHTHFENNSDGKKTLRGAGIGDNRGNKGKAYYIILTEKPEGGYEIETRLIDYDTKSLMHDINESTLNDSDKNKISVWAGVKK